VVTGAGGFIGTALLRELVRQGVAVRAVCHRHRVPHAAVPEGVLWRHGDVLAGAVDGLLAGAAAVVHLAGPPSAAESFRQPREFARTHVEGTVAVLEACQTAGVRRFVYLSSAEVYGDSSAAAVAEDHPCAPRSPYGACKLAAEHMVQVYARCGAVDASILRAFSVYGPGQPSAGVLAEILRQATRGDRVELADLRPLRDFTHVDDIAVALAAALRGQPDGVRLLNLGSGVGISIGDLAALALRVCGRVGEIRTAARGDRPAAAVVRRLIADARRATAELGWRPRIALVDGLRKLVRAALVASP
jgi:UDP-glucose 4-epimerase